MILYLIRHAEAEDVGLGGVMRDFDRPLTTRGRTQARALATAFATRQLAIDALAASPLVRAHQTGVEFLSVLAPGQRPTTCDHLALDQLKPNHLCDFLANLPPLGNRIPSREEKAVAAVGHEPDLGTFAAWLLGAAPGSIHVAKAAAACIYFPDAPEKAAGELMWLVTPEWVG